MLSLGFIGGNNSLQIREGEVNTRVRKQKRNKQTHTTELDQCGQQIEFDMTNTARLSGKTSSPLNMWYMGVLNTF